MNERYVDLHIVLQVGDKIWLENVNHHELAVEVGRFLRDGGYTVSECEALTEDCQCFSCVPAPQSTGTGWPA